MKILVIKLEHLMWN